MSTDSTVDWFTSEMTNLFRIANNIAQSTYGSCGDARIARMHGAGTLGKWYNNNVINPRGNSVEQVLKVLKPHNITLPDILTIGDKPSGSKNLRYILDQVLPIMSQRRYARQAKLIQTAQTTFNDQMADIGHEVEIAPEKTATPPGPDPNKQAHEVIDQVLNSLPRDIRHTIRTELQRRGFTLQALRQILQQHNVALP